MKIYADGVLIMEVILAVDDSIINLKSIKRLLADRYKVVPVTSAADALDYLKTSTPNLILLDILMPQMDGFEMVDIMKQDERLAAIPVIFLTADSDKEKEIESFRKGADDFIVKPFEPDIVLGRIERTLELQSLRHNLEEEVNKKTKEIEYLTMQSIMTVVNTVDAKDDYAKEHSINVAAISEELARRLGWDDKQINNMHYVALLHDIGKIGVSDTILNRPGIITDEERAHVKKHTEIGGKILEKINIENVRDGALYHHERYDGGGYPTGLKGDEIPIVARIIAVADAYDAMHKDRAYRPRLSKDKIIKEFTNERGKQFDPQITDIMLDIINEGLNPAPTETENQAESTFGESAIILQKVMSEYTTDAMEQACKDPLTKLWNRKYTVNQVNRLLYREGAKGAAFMIDIDNFKGINDTYGHLFGDEILTNISKVILDIVRQSDIPCRMGGDEFFIYFDGITDSEMLSKIASRLIESLEREVRYPDRTQGVSASVGIAVAPIDGATFEELYSSADKALYYAKNNGKKTFHFYSSTNENEEVRTGVLEDLEHIRSMLSEQGPLKGSYVVEYEGFKNIARFIRRGMERNKRNVVYILYTLEVESKARVTVDAMQEAIDGLERTIKDSLRVGDVVTRYSGAQLLTILLDAKKEDAMIVANRVVDAFGRKRLSNISVKIDMQELEVEKEEAQDN